MFMLNKRLPMKLSPEEELFLRRWMYDEVHYQEGQGPAKRLQIEHRAAPADLGILIAAAIPEPTEQEVAGMGPPPREFPKWPWAEQALPARIAEARAFLACGPRQLSEGSNVP